jgi:hypothetical protein
MPWITPADRARINTRLDENIPGVIWSGTSEGISIVLFKRSHRDIDTDRPIGWQARRIDLNSAQYWKFGNAMNLDDALHQISIEFGKEQKLSRHTLEPAKAKPVSEHRPQRCWDYHCHACKVSGAVLIPKGRMMRSVTEEVIETHRKFSGACDRKNQGDWIEIVAIVEEVNN